MNAAAEHNARRLDQIRVNHGRVRQIASDGMALSRKGRALPWWNLVAYWRVIREISALLDQAEDLIEENLLLAQEVAADQDMED